MKKDLPIIIVTHGCAGVEILNTVKMIMGEQTNIRAFDFLPHENIDSLKAKLDNLRSEMLMDIYGELSEEQQVLFVVDISNGTPWNVCSLLSKDNHNNHVVSGASIPLILDLLIRRTNTEDCKELVEKSISEANKLTKYFNGKN